MRTISNLDLKLQLTNEYLRNGGVQKILDPDLLQDIIDFNIHKPETITSRLNAFMLVIMGSQMQPPFFSEDFISEYSSFLQKSYCFDQYKIDTIEEFDKIYDEYKNTSEILYRGQSEAKWRLYSNLQRTWILNKLHKKENSYEGFLQKLVLTGQEDYEDKINEVLKEHNIDTINSISVLGFLQHHGCPTPLLDWTYKFQNALFFAMDGLTRNNVPREIEDYFSVYHIKQSDMEGGGMRQVMDESLDDFDGQYKSELISTFAIDEEQRIEMEKHFQGRKSIDIDRIFGSGIIEYITKIENMMNFNLSFFSDKDSKKGFIFSLNNSHNILNQKGVFTWNSSSMKPLEVVGNEQYFEDVVDGKADDYRFCNCLNINKNLVGHISKRLLQDGITRDFIYPTKDIDTRSLFDKISTKANS
ncbi:MAG TPA: FRG domain-containing protein [Paludibacteraceae bacterium]|nr:FRG domain-containing protein [Flavobacterium alvei]HQF10987.1 FRG domain-containing protein [Paludibacteraceae bacterium]